MTYKFISAKAVIGKIFRDLQLKDATQVSYMVEWIGEAMEHIRVYPALEKVTEELDIEMGRTELPESLVQIHQIAAKGNNGCLQPMRYRSSHFPENIHSPECRRQHSNSADQGYLINMNYIETDFEEGTLFISYTRFPVDEEGYPMIADDISFKEALKWYVVLRLTEGGWQHPAGLNYFQIQERWEHYCGQARQKAMMPDEAGMQAILDMWVRLTPNYNWFDQMFDEDGKAPRDAASDPRNIVTKFQENSTTQ